MKAFREAIRSAFTDDTSDQDRDKLGTMAALVLFAFILRCIYLQQSTANPLFDYSVVDAFVYNQWAARMAQGEWLWWEVSNYLPVYPAFVLRQSRSLAKSAKSSVDRTSL